MLSVGQDWLERAMCFYPPDLATDANLPPHLAAMLDKNEMMFVTVFIENMQVGHLSLIVIVKVINSNKQVGRFSLKRVWFNSQSAGNLQEMLSCCC